MYNCKIYDYGNEKQYRFYSKVYMKDCKSEEDKSKNEDEGKKEIEEKEDNNDNTELNNEKSVDKDRSIISSLNRTVNKIYEYARANDWEYYVTLTFNSTINRYDYDECTKAMIKFLKVTRKHNPNMQYIMVPELHKDGAYHFHGVFSNIPNVDLVDSGVYSFGKYTWKKENIPSNLLEKCRLIYNMGRYKYGYSDIQEVEDSKKTANYICKYITKELVIATKGKKRYWASRNLNKPIVSEMLLEPKHKEQIKELVKDRIIYQKKTEVDVGTYHNEIEYIDIKK
ncbi:hypothetical protein HZI73_22255 [Vallitalea pronyensis]|uniref:Replication-associated protein ORF2/G2P domain-containing protein n=1 Tax=Vallitalea pronyensis TaxID=1348613 RepID=A0A8J8MNB0_9FIRM|nr:hypothetical protein [Vallitalea pronyensis]QUI24855.1 hypothetical protein HZI73_22255 [Vallitalea pronyensis]